MSILFASGEINGMKLRNRFVRSATWEGMATPEGAVTPKLIETMALLAKGGVGLIISSHAYVRPEGQATPWQIGVYEDRLIDGLREMTAAVHEAGGEDRPATGPCRQLCGREPDRHTPSGCFRL